MKSHLAQLNIAKAKFPLNDVRMKEFVDQLDEVNKSGVKSAGFVWILKDETGTAVNFNLFNDPSLLINLTIWESFEALKNFIYSGVHASAFKRRSDWFHPWRKNKLCCGGYRMDISQPAKRPNERWKNCGIKAPHQKHSLSKNSFLPIKH